MKRTDQNLVEYFQNCLEFVDFDIEKYIKMTEFSIKYYKGDKDVREHLSPLHDLENKWYESLANNCPEYDLYGENTFLCDVWACWIVYSKKYLTALQKNIVLKNKQPIIDFLSDIQSIVDIGNGCSKTTSTLKEMFPNAFVSGTNYPGSIQYKVAEKIGKKCGFTMYPSVSDIKESVDLVFASEYFEHFEDPVMHLEEIISSANPKFFILANAFTSKAFGHFDTYKFKQRKVKNTEIGKIFNSTLRSYGFEQIKTNCWNNRPAIWAKTSSVKKSKGLF